MNIAYLLGTGKGGFGGMGIPFKSDLVQHLLKSGETDILTADGLYVKDFSGHDNHAPLKNSFMCEASADSALIAELPNLITIQSTEDYEIELYFRFKSSVVTGDRCSFLANKIGRTELSGIVFYQGNYCTFRGITGSVNFNNFIDFSVLRKYRFHVHSGVCDFYVDNTFITSKAFTNTGYTANMFIGGNLGFSSVKPAWFDVMIKVNGTLIHYWPSQSGDRDLFDVVGSNHLLTSGLNPIAVRQDVSHYNAKYGCNLYTSHSGKYALIPNMLDGTEITVDTTQGYYQYWDKVADYNPIFESTIETLNGDITYYDIRANIANKSFANTRYDYIKKDLLIYGTEKTTEEITKINKYTKYNYIEQFTYNKQVFQDIANIIKSGSVKYGILGDSLTGFLYRFHSLLDNYISLKGTGYDLISLGNSAYGLFEDIRILLTGNYEYLYWESPIDKFGIKGVATWLKPGDIVTIEPRSHLYTNFKLYYAQNTGLGTFRVTIDGVSETIDCNAAQDMGLYQRISTERGTNISIDNFTGTVYIYGFELYNSGAVGNLHFLHHGGATTQNYTNIVVPSYYPKFVEDNDLDFIFVVLGANDTQVPRTKAIYKTNMQLIVNYLKQGNPNRYIVLFSTTPRGLVAGQPGEDTAAWALARQYQEAHIELADENTNVGVWDWGLMSPSYDELLALGWMDGVVHHKIPYQEWSVHQLYKVIFNA